MSRDVLFRFILAAGLIIGLASPSVADELCPGNPHYSSPTDWSPDVDAIEWCFQNGYSEVYLFPGSPGYIFDRALYLGASFKRLSGSGGKATLLADPWLDHAMIYIGDAAYGYDVSELIVNGNASSRQREDRCGENGNYYVTSIFANGGGFRIHHLDVINAMCGAGLTVTASDYEIDSMYFASNGKREGLGQNAYGDGLTLERCNNGYVHNNYFVDNTDVDLGVGNGTNCRVMWNTIRHIGRYGFGGLVVASGDHSGSQTAYNTVESGYNLLGIGISAGNHEWTLNDPTSNVGSVFGNSASGAVVNLAVEGISGGSVYGNTMSGAQGNRGYPECSTTPLNYTAGHFGSAYVEPGYVCKIYDAGNCQNSCG